MTETKCYTVMELAEKVGVPRTTINDWLVKYSTYIGFVMQGKRRVYTENTLSVLLKVSELRAAMKSSFEIEQELAAIYAIHPEFAEENIPEQTVSDPESGTSNETAATETLPEPINSQITAEEYALAVKQQTDELTSMLGERFRDILTKMDDIELKAKKNESRAKTFSLLTILLILVLLLGGHYFWRFAEKMHTASTQKDRSIEDLQSKSLELRARTQKLQAGTEAMSKNLQQLLKDIPAQQKAFDNALKENKAMYEKIRAADRDRFAAEQLTRLKELEQLKLQLKTAEEAKKKAEQSLDNARKDAEKQKIQMDLLRQKNSELQKNSDVASVKNADKTVVKTDAKTTVKTN